jgi:catechol-2,3-dioxygenase
VTLAPANGDGQSLGETMLYLLLLAASASPASEQQMARAPVAAIVDHIGLYVSNPLVSATFYQRVLGLQPFPQKVSPTMRWLGSGNFQLHLIGGRTKPVETATVVAP